MLKTPILFIIFNRIDTTKQVFAKIKEVQPQQLFIAADGPRKNRLGEEKKCKAVREWVLSQVDWDCKVYTLFRDENLGCGRGPAQAITWFFDNVEQGIILEDDCVPDISFFNYCETLLEYYKNDERIMHITGYNPEEISHFKHNISYCFVPIEICWGWASWRQAWNKFQFNITKTEEIFNHCSYFKHKPAREYWGSVFNSLQKESFSNNIWDYQWTYAILKNNGYCIVPQKNLIQNIGFISDSTHFDGSDNRFMKKVHSLSEIRHCKKIEYNKALTKYIDTFLYCIPHGIKHELSTKIYSVKRRLISPTKKILKNFFYRLLDLRTTVSENVQYIDDNSYVQSKTRLFAPYRIAESKIGEYTYVQRNAFISMTDIGKFCSIGPNLFCGWGIHPTNFISTSPMFYSTMKQNGFSLCSKNKIIEREKITIGNDVFIGANVTILDGVTIGDGAIIGAGAVVAKDIPPYAIAGGVPAKVIKYRFTPEQIEKLLQIQWWNFQEADLQDIEKYYNDIDDFIKKYEKLI